MIQLSLCPQSLAPGHVQSRTQARCLPLVRAADNLTCNLPAGLGSHPGPSTKLGTILIPATCIAHLLFWALPWG